MPLRNIGRLTEKYPRAARLYHIEVEPGEKDKRTCKIKTASIKWTKKEKKEKKETEAQKKQGTYLPENQSKRLDRQEDMGNLYYAWSHREII